MSAVVSKFRSHKVRRSVKGMSVWIDHPPLRSPLDRLIKGFADMAHRYRLERMRRDIEIDRLARRRSV
jgi:hypothetical protein